MKVKLSMELELPEYCATVSKDHLTEILFDAVVNYACVRHSTDATHWIAKGNDELSAHHSLWADILFQTEWSFDYIQE